MSSETTSKLIPDKSGSDFAFSSRTYGQLPAVLSVQGIRGPVECGQQELGCRIPPASTGQTAMTLTSANISTQVRKSFTE